MRLGRMTIFALNIMAVHLASISFQLLTAVGRRSFEALKRKARGRPAKRLNQYTRYGTVLLAAVQFLRDRGSGWKHALRSPIGG